MICAACRNATHVKCKGGTWCDCQHRPRPVEAEPWCHRCGLPAPPAELTTGGPGDIRICLSCLVEVTARPADA